MPHFKDIFFAFGRPLGLVLQQRCKGQRWRKGGLQLCEDIG
jgi:hypothetical protein